MRNEVMNWDDLRIFTAVARCSTLGAASAVLKINISTISRRIQKLEQSLGTTLFKRSRRGHSLTVHGQKLMEHCEQMDRAAIACYDTSNRTPETIDGSLRISTAEGFGATIFVPAIRDFLKQYPHINIDLVSGSGFLSLSRREADISIGLSKSKSKRIQSRKLLDYELGLFVSPDYLKDKAKISELTDLENHILIGYIDDLIYAPELNYFETVFPYAAPAIRCSSILAQKKLVEEGSGIAILPTFITDTTLTRLFPDEIALQRSFWVSAHKAICETERYKAFDNFLRAYF